MESDANFDVIFQENFVKCGPKNKCLLKSIIGGGINFRLTRLKSVNLVYELSFVYTCVSKLTVDEFKAIVTKSKPGLALKPPKNVKSKRESIKISR